MKKCGKCGKVQDRGCFHIDRRNLSNGLQNQCKTCRAEFDENKRRDAGVKPLRRNDPTADIKVCTICGYARLKTEFPVDVRTTDGRGSECLGCKRRASNAANRRRGIAPRVPQSAGNTHKTCRTCNRTLEMWQFHGTYHGRNADKKMPHCKLCWAKRSRETATRLRSWYTAYRAARRSMKMMATPAWLTESQVSAMRTVYDHARDCTLVTGERYEVDHIVPIKGKHVCGLHVPWNLQVLPMSENRKKSNKVVT